MGIGSLLKYYIVAVLSIALNSVPSAIASMSCALIAEGKINIPKLAEAESFYQEIDTIWRHYPEGIHSGDERTRLANHLVTLAEDYLQASGVQYEKLPNGQGLLISGVQSKTIGPNWNRIAAEKKVTFIYHPAYLLYNVDLATGPVLSHEIEWVPITHLDLLLGPRSELVQRLLKLHLFGHKNHSALGPIYGEIYAQHPKTLEFARALSHHLDPLLFTKDWGSLHLENVSTNLLNAAEPHLNAHGVQVERLHQPDRIRIVPNIGGHQLNQLAYRIGAQLHYPVNFYYDPMQNLGPGIDASHISSASKRVEGRYSEVFLDEREILYLKRFYGFVIDTAEDARWAQLHVLLNNYRYRQSGLYAPYSLGEPIFVKVARDGSYLKSLSKSSAVREWNLAEPFMTGIIQVKTTRKDWLKVAIDEFIESMSGNTIYPVGSAVQFGNDRSVVLLNLGATKGHSVPYPPHYLKTALVSYLEHLKIIYKSKLGISNERFKKLADISINAEKRSHLLGVVKNTWIDERGKTKLDPSVKLSQLSEIYQKNAQEFSNEIFKGPLDFESGLIIVNSRGAHEPLPSESLHGFKIPRQDCTGIEGQSIVEIGRLSGSLKDQEVIDYIKLAATFLMRAHGDRVCKIYIEVNASRKRLLGGLGFKEASVQPASGGAQYQDGTDFLLEVDPYDFALAAFAR